MHYIVIVQTASAKQLNVSSDFACSGPPVTIFHLIDIAHLIEKVSYLKYTFAQLFKLSDVDI